MANGIGIGIAVAVIVALAVRHVPATWARAAVRRWNDLRPWLVAWVLSSPATFVYLAILFVTTWVLRSSNARVAHILLLNHSTNLTHLRREPVNVLVTSAFYADGSTIAMWAALFALVAASVERWLGSMRTVLAFFTGHVVATLVSAIGISIAVRHGRLTDLRNVVDVGVSYGFYCIAALATYRLRGWYRWAWILGLEAMVLRGLPGDVDFTDLGHIVAVQVGLALWPLTRATRPIANEQDPLVRLAPRRVEAVRTFGRSFRAQDQTPAPTTSDTAEMGAEPRGSAVGRQGRGPDAIGEER